MAPLASVYPLDVSSNKVDFERDLLMGVAERPKGVPLLAVSGVARRSTVDSTPSPSLSVSNPRCSVLVVVNAIEQSNQY